MEKLDTRPGDYIIRMRDICKSYGSGETKTEVLKNISFDVRRGEFVAILGPSGSGKSTLMNLIGLIDTADSGRYLLSGEDVDGRGDNEYSTLRNKRLGFVFQRFNLIAKYTALQNVALPLLYRGCRSKEAEYQARKLLIALGMGDRLGNRPNQLSGGQQQRVAIARAIITSPDLILADEPTGALDSVTGREVLSLMQSLNRKGKTIILITHDHSVSQRAGRVLNIEDGRIYEQTAAAGS